MNILHMKYALEVAQTGSINKASENLFIAQPNLSRAIKELESDLGVTLFERTRKGMNLTIEGREFVKYAKQILKEINDVENMYRERKFGRKKLSVGVYSTDYITDVINDFTCKVSDFPFEFSFTENDSLSIIRGVASSEYRLGIIRITEKNEDYYSYLLREKELTIEKLCEKESFITVNKNFIKSEDDEIIISDSMTEIGNVESEESSNNEISLTNRKININSIEKQLELLSMSTSSFMIGSTISGEKLKRYGLIQRKYPNCTLNFRDYLIYKKECRFTETELEFINILKKNTEKEK